MSDLILSDSGSLCYPSRLSNPPPHFVPKLSPKYWPRSFFTASELHRIAPFSPSNLVFFSGTAPWYLSDGASCPSTVPTIGSKRDDITACRFCGCPGRTRSRPRPSRSLRIVLVASETKILLVWSDVRRIEHSCCYDSVNTNDVHARRFGSFPTPMVVSAFSRLRGRSTLEHSTIRRCIRGSGLAVV